jgi:hypothetical protein
MLRAGSTIADGRYRIVEPIGEGSMGRVYRAYDARLETDVVVKFPLPPGSDLRGSEQLERFGRELHSLVALSHPHIVRVIDAGDLGGEPYVVMQYLAGGTLRDRQDRNGGSLPPVALADWLTEVSRALDFVHAQGFIHRDVKPANILFDVHGNPYLGDFGIIKALASSQESDARGNELTAPGYLLGTPSYIAPEIVMGAAADGRADQYSLALTVHEVLTGRNYMAGASPSATLVNQTTVAPPALADLIPSMSRRLSDAIHRALAKDPAERFPNCSTLAREILHDLPIGGEGTAKAAPANVGRSGISTAFLASPMLKGDRKPGRRVVFAIVGLAALALVAPLLLWRWLAPGHGGDEHGRSHVVARPLAAAPDSRININIAYGTEKRRWLEAALTEFGKTPDGQRIRVTLVPKGSVDGAQAVLNGPGNMPIHVWSPASSAYRDTFERSWIEKHKTSPIAEAKDLALTPMVFVMWKARHEAFVKHYGAVTFRTVGQAMREPKGWEAIAQRSEWGSAFKFSHTDPVRSNSGLLSLVLVAYDFAGKQRGLRRTDVEKHELRGQLVDFETNVTARHGSLVDSTGHLMEDMVNRGPSEYDCLLVYENLAIDFMKLARDRWGESGELRVIYPDPNIWNENPYYILNVPWSSPVEREASLKFLAFLMSEPIQRAALKYGFRPGDPSIGLHNSESPLVRAATYGVRVDVPRVCEPPRAEVVKTLLGIARAIER